MENHPSKDSTTDNKSPPSDDDTNKGDGSGEIKIIKTPLQVLTELAESPKSNIDGGEGDGGGDGGMSLSGGTSLALAVAGGPMVVVQGPGGGEGQRGKKRKSSDVKDPPSGKPSCPLCFKEFASWKGAFGHMRKHPDRQYRGFFKPLVSSPPPLARESLGDDDQGDGGENKNVEGKSEVLFDLNQPMDGAGPSNAEERNKAPVSPLPPPPPTDQERIVDEGRKFGFDLNELPPTDEN